MFLIFIRVDVLVRTKVLHMACCRQPQTQRPPRAWQPDGKHMLSPFKVQILSQLLAAPGNLAESLSRARGR